MISTRSVREYLQAAPFRPFRIFVSDGSSHDIPHPEFAWLIGPRLYVGRIVKEGGLEDAEVKELAILHITRIERLAKTKTRK